LDLSIFEQAAGASGQQRMIWLCHPISPDIRQPGRQGRADNSWRQLTKQVEQTFRDADCEGRPYSSINYQLCLQGVIQMSRAPGVGIENTSTP
jgi:hypothetical protein